MIEEHPINEPVLWISNIFAAPKPDGNITMAMDARNVNRAILPSNLPIPRNEDIKVKKGKYSNFFKT